MIIIYHYCAIIITLENWNTFAKRHLKAEMIRRGFNTSDVVLLLKRIGITETKASIDSKISRGTFSASFFLQILSVIGCNRLEINYFKPNDEIQVIAEPLTKYEKRAHDKKND